MATRSRRESEIKPLSEDLDDEQLVREFRQGRETAFDALVHRYEFRVRRLVMGFVRDDAVAEDVAQDTFVQAYSKISRLQDPSSFRSWLFAIAVNRARDEVRRSRRWLVDSSQVEEVVSELRASDDASSRAQGRQLGKLLSDLVRGLPPKLREAILLKEIEEMTYAEISQTLGIPMGTAQIRVHRARLRLRADLEDLGLDTKLATGQAPREGAAPPAIEAKRTGGTS